MSQIACKLSTEPKTRVTNMRSEAVFICSRGTYMRRFTSTAPARGARVPNRAISINVYDIKMYLKKLFDKRFRRIFSSAFQ